MSSALRPRWIAARLALGLLVAALLAPGCATTPRSAAGPSPLPSPAAFPITLTDDDGVSLTLRSAPHRIVTWGPSNTEIVFALGLASRLVGVSGKFDDHPPAARSLPEVGDASGVEPDVEKVVSQRPSLVLNAFLGGEEWKSRLRRLGIPVFSIYATNFDDALHDIRTVGELTGTERSSLMLTSGMREQATLVEAEVAKGSPVSCFLEEGYPGIYTVGPHTFVFDMLKRAGCEPVTASAKSDYPTWSLERLVQQDPLVYLVASESGATAAEVAQRPGFGSLRAVRTGRVHDVDSDLISRPGPRLVQGLEALVKVLHG